jgi:pimeloyl-ACP methyl ester carboxylesterase
MTMHIERFGSGKPIIFIHGAGGSGVLWYMQKEYLKDFTQVVLVDLPGHGGSQGKGFTSIEDYRDVCYERIREAGWEACFVVGHSMGGAIAMSLALTYPDMAAGLILVGTGARLRVVPDILDGIRRDKKKTIKSIVEYAFSEKAPQKVKEEGVAEMMKCDANVICGDFLACDHFNLLGSLDRIKAPTLIVCGTDDRLTPPTYSTYLHEHITDSSLVLVEDAGHMVMIEKPQEVNKAIENFVRTRIAGDR